jgi:hypothetical protein
LPAESLPATVSIVVEPRWREHEVLMRRIRLVALAVMIPARMWSSGWKGPAYAGGVGISVEGGEAEVTLGTPAGFLLIKPRHSGTLAFRDTRRVAELANGVFEAGFHALDWNRQGERGRLRPGVYLYRLQAGAYRAQRKLVLLP